MFKIYYIRYITLLYWIENFVLVKTKITKIYLIYKLQFEQALLDRWNLFFKLYLGTTVHNSSNGCLFFSKRSQYLKEIRMRCISIYLNRLLLWKLMHSFNMFNTGSLYEFNGIFHLSHWSVNRYDYK